MPSNEDPFSEAIQLKKAKKRLLGALIILVGLLILSYFFLEDRSSTNSQNIKISFIDEGGSSIDNDVDQSSENLEVDNFFIQIGIFSDKEKNSINKKNLVQTQISKKRRPIALNEKHKEIKKTKKR